MSCSTAECALPVSGSQAPKRHLGPSMSLCPIKLRTCLTLQRVRRRQGSGPACTLLSMLHFLAETMMRRRSLEDNAHVHLQRVPHWYGGRNRNCASFSPAASVARVDHVINKSTGKKSDPKHANHQANWDKHLWAERAERVPSPRGIVEWTSSNRNYPGSNADSDRLQYNFYRCPPSSTVVESLQASLPRDGSVALTAM